MLLASQDTRKELSKSNRLGSLCNALIEGTHLCSAFLESKGLLELCKSRGYFIQVSDKT